MAVTHVVEGDFWLKVVVELAHRLRTAGTERGVVTAPRSGWLAERDARRLCKASVLCGVHVECAGVPRVVRSHVTARFFPRALRVHAIT